VTLLTPAISLPCLILGRPLRQFRVVALLSGAVMLAGITAGLILL
jgi:hypothetical protein